ncbi:hypothetical protein RDI58_028607 [Solanum bulbocastanum]|uniref:Uncharacterized protein n=1 Tax=Solanum bulbocastanum TaxID=147425 RepID=A0AAN8SP89_SOLBU
MFHNFKVILSSLNYS